MKLEAGESLAISWLKHVKNCRVVQQNWKATPSMMRSVNSNDRNRNDHVLDMVYEKASQFLETDEMTSHQAKIFKNNQRRSQFVKQCEIDVMGLCMAEDYKISKVYMVEVAFHEDGLNYNGKHKTAANVIKKMFRCALIAHEYFETRSEVIFATPKISKPTWELVEHQIIKLREFWQGQSRLSTVEFTFLSDKSDPTFCNEILIPLLHSAGEVSDSNELFLRSWQLLTTAGCKISIPE